MLVIRCQFVVFLCCHLRKKPSSLTRQCLCTSKLNHLSECHSRCSFVGTSTTKSLIVSTGRSVQCLNHKYTLTECVFCLFPFGIAKGCVTRGLMTKTSLLLQIPDSLVIHQLQPLRLSGRPGARHFTV